MIYFVKSWQGEAFALLLSASSQLLVVYPLLPFPMLLGISAILRAQPAHSEQPALGHAHFPRLQEAIFIPPAAFDPSGMKLPLKKGAPGRCSPARDSCAGLPGPLGRLWRAGLPIPCCQRHHSSLGPKAVLTPVGSAMTLVLLPSHL